MAAKDMVVQVESSQYGMARKHGMVERIRIHACKQCVDAYAAKLQKQVVLPLSMLTWVVVLVANFWWVTAHADFDRVSGKTEFRVAPAFVAASLVFGLVAQWVLTRPATKRALPGCKIDDAACSFLDSPERRSIANERLRERWLTARMMSAWSGGGPHLSGETEFNLVSWRAWEQ